VREKLVRYVEFDIMHVTYIYGYVWSKWLV